jgi:hypothetical protein
MKRAVAYLRVSTAQQGRSGLGIEAQRQAVEAFAAANGHVLAAELVKVETGPGAGADAAGRADARRRQPLAGGAGAARARSGRVTAPGLCEARQAMLWDPGCGGRTWPRIARPGGSEAISPLRLGSSCPWSARPRHRL